MSREIVTERDRRRQVALAQGEPEPLPVDDYISRLIKYIPTEVIVVYLSVENIIKSTTPAMDGTAVPEQNIQGLYWGVFLFLLIMTPIYTLFVLKVTKRVQLVVSTIAFAVWVFSLGGPFEAVDWYDPIYGAVLLPLYTFAVGVIQPESLPEEPINPGGNSSQGQV
jgi:hypothetical protein